MTTNKSPWSEGSSAERRVKEEASAFEREIARQFYRRYPRAAERTRFMTQFFIRALAATMYGITREEAEPTLRELMGNIGDDVLACLDDLNKNFRP